MSTSSKVDVTNKIDMQHILDSTSILSDKLGADCLSDPKSSILSYLSECKDLIDNHYIVYAHILPDKSAYIGMTGVDIASRAGKNGHAYKENQANFYEAIESAGGWDNIKHYVLAQGCSYSEASNLEAFFIQLFENAGFMLYNLRSGKKGWTKTKKVKDKILNSKILGASTNLSESEYHQFATSNSNVVNYFEKQPKRKGRPCSESAKAKMREAMKKRTSDPKWKEWMSSIHKGKLPHNAKKIIAILPDSNTIEFNSIQECSNYFNISDYCINKCCNSNVKYNGIQLNFKEDLNG